MRQSHPELQAWLDHVQEILDDEERLRTMSDVPEETPEPEVEEVTEPPAEPGYARSEEDEKRVAEEFGDDAPEDSKDASD